MFCQTGSIEQVLQPYRICFNIKKYDKPAFNGMSNKRSANMINIRKNKNDRADVETIMFRSPTASLLQKYDPAT